MCAGTVLGATVLQPDLSPLSSSGDLLQRHISPVPRPFHGMGLWEALRFQSARVWWSHHPDSRSHLPVEGLPHKSMWGQKDTGRAESHGEKSFYIRTLTFERVL